MTEIIYQHITRSDIMVLIPDCNADTSMVHTRLDIIKRKGYKYG